MQFERAKLLQAKRSIFKSSLAAFAREGLQMKDINLRTHGDMIAALEDHTCNRKLMIMPRGSLKTSIGSVAYPIWCLLRNPNERILLDSELYTNSKNRLREIRQHLESDSLCELFGTFKSNVWNESEIQIAQRTKIYREASITCSGLGASKTGAHYSKIIADDLNSALNSNTKEGCEKVVNHYRMATSILDPGGEIVLVGTRYSANDVYQFVLDNEINAEEGLMSVL